MWYGRISPKSILCKRIIRVINKAWFLSLPEIGINLIVALRSEVTVNLSPAIRRMAPCSLYCLSVESSNSVDEREVVYVHNSSLTQGFAWSSCTRYPSSYHSSKPSSNVFESCLTFHFLSTSLLVQLFN